MRWAPLPLGALFFLGAVGLVLAFAFLRPGPLIMVGVIAVIFAPGRWWRWRTRRFRKGARAIQRGDLATGRAELEAFLDDIEDPKRFDRIQPFFNLGKRYPYRAAALGNLGVAALTTAAEGRRAGGKAGGPDATPPSSSAPPAPPTDLARARSRFEEAIAVDPEYVPARFGLAMVSQLAGDAERAETEAEQAVAHRPGYLPARLLLAAIRRQRGDEAGSEELLEPLRRKGKDPDQLLARFGERWPVY